MNKNKTEKIKEATSISSEKGKPVGKKSNNKRQANSVKKKTNLKQVKEGSFTRNDQLKLVLAVIVLLLGVAGFYFSKSSSGWFHSSMAGLAYIFPLIGVGLFLVIIFYWCSFGFDLINYVRYATIELKKVVWPDSKVASRITLLVMVVVAILALYMWVSDSLIQWVLYDLILRRGS